jgi:hypothetical protein
MAGASLAARWPAASGFLDGLPVVEPVISAMACFRQAARTHAPDIRTLSEKVLANQRFAVHAPELVAPDITPEDPTKKAVL